MKSQSGFSGWLWRSETLDIESIQRVTIPLSSGQLCKEWGGKGKCEDRGDNGLFVPVESKHYGSPIASVTGG